MDTEPSGGAVSAVDAAMTPVRLRQLELLRRREDPKAIRELVEQMEPAVKRYAAKYARLSKMDVEDLQAEARIAVLHAIQDFDEDKGFAWTTIAFQRIEWWLIRQTKNLSSEVRLPIHKWDAGLRPLKRKSGSQPVRSGTGAEDSDATIFDLMADDAPSAEDELAAEDERQLVREVLSRMSEKRRSILQGRMEGKTLQEVGDKLGLSRERIRQLEEDAHYQFRRLLRSLRRPAGKSVLRDYQRDAVIEAKTALESAPSALFVCPTGGGKTHVMAELANATVDRGRILMLADREMIVSQTLRRVQDYTGLSAGMEQGESFVDIDALPDVVCATIQAISREDRLSRFPQDAFALIVIDEADLAVAPSYLAVLRHFKSARVFGCTATPMRSDGQDISSVFSARLTPVALLDLVARGFLSPLRRFGIVISSVDLSRTALRGGDFAEEDLENQLTKEKALHEIVVPTMRISEMRPTLVFAASIEHAEQLEEIFNRYEPGCAASAHGGTPLSDRQDLLQRFASGTIRFLCSCGLYLRGADLPFVSCIAMARPTASHSLYCQAVGRGLRPSKGKDDLIVIDFTDSSRRYDIMTAIDLLTPVSPEARTLARERLDSMHGGNPLEVVEHADLELEIDPALAQAVRAEVEYDARPIERIDWDHQPLG